MRLSELVKYDIAVFVGNTDLFIVVRSDPDPGITTIQFEKDKSIQDHFWCKSNPEVTYIKQGQ